eukprot:TRINITY_DN7120_c0_g1_i3.p1 TRINITY_DN7120_c0_g1~~TRINITY_DN7120_c0_g1_i3.p1  ORF type:complete len:211 (+),score=50.37 TRINITY_DN7120_c0_g1_i3:179-811(+)
MSLMTTLFGGPKITPEERVRQWKRDLKREERVITRAIADINREEAKVVIEVKKAARANQPQIARSLAKQIVMSRKAKERLYRSRAELNSVSLQLTEQLATLKMTGVMARSAKVMASMNRLTKIEQIQQSMHMMAMEMEKSGLIQEMVDDLFDDDEVEEEANAEVDRVYDELTLPLRQTLAPQTALPQQQQQQPAETDTELMKRLNALQSN